MQSAKSNGRWVLSPFKTFIETVVHEDTAFLAEGADPFFFETHIDPFAVTDVDGVYFCKGFVDETNVTFNFLIIDPDLELPEQLTEGEFYEVMFFYPNFHTEFHN